MIEHPDITDAMRTGYPREDRHEWDTSCEHVVGYDELDDEDEQEEIREGFKNVRRELSAAFGF